MLYVARNSHLHIQQVHKPEVIRLPPPGINKNCSNSNNSTSQSLEQTVVCSNMARQAGCHGRVCLVDYCWGHTFISLLYLLKPPLGHVIPFVPVRMPLLQKKTKLGQQPVGTIRKDHKGSRGCGLTLARRL
jgi:hypothetical protein